MTRILIVVDCYLPSEKSAARLASDLAHAFSRQGNPVTVLTPSNAVAERAAVEENDGVRVVRFRVGKIKGARHVLRAINEISLSLVAWARCRRLLLQQQPHDLIVFYSPSIFFGPLVWWLKGKWNARSYLVLRDIFPDWAVDTGVLRTGLVYRVFKVFEGLQYRAADVIGVETAGSTKYFADKPQSSKVEVLSNWAVVQNAPRATGTFRRQLGLEGKVVFFYGGNIGVAQDMDNIMRLARRMMDRQDVHFLLVGSGSHVEYFENLIEMESIKNVTILPAVDQDTYFSMLAEFDVGLISLDRRLKSCNYPGKLLGYLQCSMPVLASLNPGNDLAEFLQEQGAGYVSINGEDEVFYQNAVRLCDAPLRAAMGKKARELLEEHFSVERVADQILGCVLQDEDRKRS